MVPEPGNHDVMSRAAKMARLPLCGASSPEGRTCSRAAGHDETIRQHPSARKHVAIDEKYVILEVFS
jgi:hypothetical protein